MAIHNKIVNPRSGGTTATTDASELITGILANARLGTGIPVNKLADGSISDEELQYLDGLTADLVTLLALKANSANPTFTGTVSGVTKTHVGLPNVPNTDATNASNIGTGTLPDARLSTNIRRSLVDSFPVDDYIIPSCVVGLAEVAKTYNLPGALTSSPSCIAKVVGLGAQSGQFTVRAEVTATDTVTVYYSYNDNSAGTIDIGEKTVYIENTKA